MKTLLQKFKDDDNGSMSIELLIVTPILVWALLSTFVYFDLYRVESNANRAALTLADMFSREETPITPAYLNGARQLLRTLTFEETNPDFRVTVYRYREGANDYRRVWSQNRGGVGNYRNTDLNKLQAANRLPVMADGDRAILVQTFVDYDAPFSIGLGPFTAADLQDLRFDTFVVIRPRPGRLCWDRNPSDDSNTVLC